MKIDKFECDQCGNTIDQQDETTTQKWAALFLPSSYLAEGILINVTQEKHFCCAICLTSWVKQNLSSI